MAALMGFFFSLSAASWWISPAPAIFTPRPILPIPLAPRHLMNQIGRQVNLHHPCSSQQQNPLAFCDLYMSRQPHSLEVQRKSKRPKIKISVPILEASPYSIRVKYNNQVPGALKKEILLSDYVIFVPSRCNLWSITIRNEEVR